MKITTNTAALAHAIILASTYTSNDSGQLRIEGADNGLIIKATNGLETIVFKNIPFTSSDLTQKNFDAIAIDAKKISNLLKKSKTKETTLDIESEKHIVVISGRSKAKIDKFDKVQEIEIAKCKKTILLDGNILSGFHKVLHAIDSNNPKFELNGALFSIKDNVCSIVSTDTRRLSIISAETDIEDAQMIIPKQTVQTIIKLFSSDGIAVQFDENTFVVRDENIEYSTKLINGKFPDWSRIVPPSTEKILNLKSNNFRELIKEASVFSDEIAIHIRGNQITISDIEGNVNVQDTLEIESDDILFGINAKYILDFLDASDNDTITIGFNNGNLPILLQTADNYKEVVMPLILDNYYEDENLEAA